MSHKPTENRTRKTQDGWMKIYIFMHTYIATMYQYINYYYYNVNYVIY